MLVVFNKCDVENTEVLVTWMKDYDKYLVNFSFYDIIKYI